MNEEQKEFLDEQYRHISKLSDNKVRELLKGLPPLEAGGFFSVAIHNSDGSNFHGFDMDALYFKLKSKIASSTKFDENVVKTYMKEEDINYGQAKTLLVLRNQYLCNEFPNDGVSDVLKMFEEGIADVLDKFITRLVNQALENWRNSLELSDISFKDLPRFFEIKQSYIQNPLDGRRVGDTKELTKSEIKERKDFYHQLLTDAVESILENTVNPEKIKITQKMVAEKIIKVEKAPKKGGRNESVKPEIFYKVGTLIENEKLLKINVAKTTVSNWLIEYRLSLEDIEDKCRAKLFKS